MQEPKPLYNQIDEALATSQFDKQSLKFLPDGVIDSLITQQTIMWAFKRKNFPKDDISKALALANSILEEKFKKVFATAVIIGLTGNDLQQGMQKFKDAGISDDTLPINQGDLSRKGVISPPKIKDTISIGNVKGLNDNKGVENRGVDYWNRPDEDETDEDDSGEIWTSVRASNFCEKQWLFLSPVFSTSKFIHEFTQMCIMPFTKKYLECDSGTFGQVTKYEIHESHLIDPDNSGFRCPEFVAVKELAVKNKEDRQNIFNTWGKEAKALQKMNSLKQPHIVWFYTAFQRGIPGGQDHYLMLEWASGGNLRNFWKSFKRPALTSKLIRATVHQLLGLVKAINKAHYPETGPNFRHGDLKPENILWFKDESGHGIGTFKIGDWGLAKQHFRVTEMRSRRTTTKWGTRRYEPPEEADSQGANLLASDQLGKRRSRLYDIWALGCITLEFVIWLMYGPDELDRFNRGLEVNNSDNSRFYLIKPVTGGRPEAKVHDVAIEWMKHMARDPICTPGSTALGNLLELIETRLLVVQLPKRLGTFIDLSHDSKPPESDTAILSNSSSFQQADPIASPLGSHSLPDIVINDPELRKALTGRNTPIQPRPRAPGRERARADELLDQMLIISGEDEEQSYWFTDVPKPPRGPNVDGIRQRLEYLPVGSLSLGGTERIDYGHTKISDEWNVLLDNNFAKHVLSSINTKSLPLPHVPLPSKLCNSCRKLQKRIWEPFFDILYSSQDLKDNLGTCDLCRMVWRVYQKHAITTDPEIMLERVGSSIKINGEEPPVLSIYRSLGLDTGINQELQIGYPRLAEANSETYFELLRHWLKHCDHSHKDTTCRPVSAAHS